MPYEMTVHAQDASSGRVGEVLAALEGAAQAAVPYDHVDIAVAYASAEGVRLLEEAVAGKYWVESRKRFLVSMDFGFTQPRALTLLSEIANAEVRIPNGSKVLESPSLRPPSAFHPKVFVFRGDQWFKLSALIVGSANLTASALSTGSEVVSRQLWTGSYPTEAWNSREQAKPLLDWFDYSWETADPLIEVIEPYKQRRRALPAPHGPREERTRSTRRYLASADDHAISGSLSVQFAEARTLWVEASSMIKNRGTAAGNQLNTPRGTRVFFGFDSDHVPRNTTLGSVAIRVEGYSYVPRSIRFGDNGMDIVGLPIPEDNGIDTYEGSYLVFTREMQSVDGQERFTLRPVNAEALSVMRERAHNSVEHMMRGGRRFGLLF